MTTAAWRFDEVFVTAHYKCDSDHSKFDEDWEAMISVAESEQVKLIYMWEEFSKEEKIHHWHAGLKLGDKIQTKTMMQWRKLLREHGVKAKVLMAGTDEGIEKFCVERRFREEKGGQDFQKWFAYDPGERMVFASRVDVSRGIRTGYEPVYTIEFGKIEKKPDAYDKMPAFFANGWAEAVFKMRDEEDGKSE